MPGTSTFWRKRGIVIYLFIYFVIEALSFLLSCGHKEQKGSKVSTGGCAGAGNLCKAAGRAK